MPIPVQTPGPAEQLEDRFAFKGGMKMTVDETIVPVEVLVPRPRKFVIGEADVAAAVGFRSEVAVFNPIPFNRSIQDTEIRIHKIWISSVSVMTFEIVQPNVIVGFTDLATKTFLNLAMGGPQGQILEDNTAIATAAAAFFRARVLANTTFVLDLFKSPIILDTARTSAQAVMIRPIGDNLALDVSVLWSEPADPA